MVVRHALDGQRDVVVTRAFAVARTCDRIETYMVRLAVAVVAGRYDANRLSFQNGKRHGAEIEHDVTNVRRRTVARQPKIAHHSRDRGVRERVQIDVRVRGRPRWRRSAALPRRRERRDLSDFGWDRRV